jgi:hypothetical protein
MKIIEGGGSMGQRVAILIFYPHIENCPYMRLHNIMTGS